MGRGQPRRVYNKGRSNKLSGTNRVHVEVRIPQKDLQYSGTSFRGRYSSVSATSKDKRKIELKKILFRIASGDETGIDVEAEGIALLLDVCLSKGLRKKFADAFFGSDFRQRQAAAKHNKGRKKRREKIMMMKK